MKNEFLVKLQVVVLFLTVTCLFISCDSSSKKLSFDEMRLRYRETLIPSDLDPNDSIIKARTIELDKSVKEAWTTLNKVQNRDYLWEDSKARFAEAQALTIDYGRLGSMTQSYYTPGSQYYKNDSLKVDIIAGLDWMFDNRYNPQTPMYHNWWEWVIGVPMGLSNTITLLYDDLTEQQRKNYLSAMDYYAPNVTFEGASTGANKIWQCGNMVIRGILAKRADQVKIGVDGLDTEFKYADTKDGFYKDGSFVQHQWHAYNGGYGASMLSHMANVIPMVQGSEWEVPQHHQKMLFEWIRNGYEPFMVRGAIMDMVRGREMSRTYNDRSSGHSILRSILILSEVAPEEERAHMQSFVKAQILSDTYINAIPEMPTFLLAKARKLIEDPSVKPEEPKTLNKIFSAMDRVVHIRPTFTIGLAMSSNRIENYETINGENLKSWYTADGMIYLYDNDLRQYSDSYWPTTNYYRLPGTTVDTQLRKAETLPFAKGLLYADGYKSPEKWVGGSSICNQYGMIGMALNAFESNLTAKKSWFMVEDEIVALGAGINSTDNRTIETIVESRKLNSDVKYTFAMDNKTILTANGVIQPTSTRWINMKGTEIDSNIGYYFPESPDLLVQRETRTGSWYDINQPYSPKDPISRDYFSIWFDHGKNPKNATYAYVILPGKDANQTAKYAEKPTIKIIENTPHIQAIQHEGTKVTGINFWEAASQDDLGIKVNTPASVIMKDSSNELIIGISDPTHEKSEIEVELKQAASGVSIENPNITVISTSPSVKLKVNVSGTLGQTQSITLKK